MTFTPGQLTALRKLRELWPNTPFVLGGASAHSILRRSFVSREKSQDHGMTAGLVLGG
jgi:hypothetical protein